MKSYYLYDSQGYYLGELPLESGEPSTNSTDTPPAIPNYLPRWDGTKWIEERPAPHNGKEWNQDTKEWDLEPVEPEPDYAAFLRGLMGAE